MSEPNECPRLIEVQRLWDGEIGAIAATELRRHLAHCSSCRAEYESWDRLSGLLARGDPARPLAPERQRLMKQTLLDACAASVPRPHAAPRRRIALALAPLGAAALLLLSTGRRVPPGEPRPTGVKAPVQAALPRPGDPASPRPPAIARAIVPPKQASLARPKRARSARRRPLLAARPRRGVHAVRLAVVPRARLHGWESQRLMPVTPADHPATVSRRTIAAAPPPIERLVIQVDEQALRRAETPTVTHITVIATGDPAAPHAQLAIVRSQTQEVVP